MNPSKFNLKMKLPKSIRKNKMLARFSLSFGSIVNLYVKFQHVRWKLSWDRLEWDTTARENNNTKVSSSEVGIIDVRTMVRVGLSTLPKLVIPSTLLHESTSVNFLSINSLE